MNLDLSAAAPTTAAPFPRGPAPAASAKTGGTATPGGAPRFAEFLASLDDQPSAAGQDHARTRKGAGRPDGEADREGSDEQDGMPASEAAAAVPLLGAVTPLPAVFAPRPADAVAALETSAADTPETTDDAAKSRLTAEDLAPASAADAPGANAGWGVGAGAGDGTNTTDGRAGTTESDMRAVPPPDSVAAGPESAARRPRESKGAAPEHAATTDATLPPLPLAAEPGVDAAADAALAAVLDGVEQALAPGNTWVDGQSLHRRLESGRGGREAAGVGVHSKRGAPASPHDAASIEDSEQPPRASGPGAVHAGSGPHDADTPRPVAGRASHGAPPAAFALAAFHAASVLGGGGGTMGPMSVGGVASPELLDAELPLQVVQAIRLQWAERSGEAHVRLQPGFLGGMTVGIQVDGGSVVASLNASAAEVREWMRTNEPALRQALADQGLTLERLVIADEERASTDDEPREQQDRQDEPRHRPRRSSTQNTFELVV